MDITKQQYLSDPCGASSLPYWKTVDPSRPERLYRRCSFQGNDIWHILKRKKGSAAAH